MTLKRKKLTLGVGNRQAGEEREERDESWNKEEEETRKSWNGCKGSGEED